MLATATSICALPIATITASCRVLAAPSTSANRGHDTKVSFVYVRQERTTNDRDWWWVQPVESGRCTSRVESVTPVRTRRSAASLSADSAPD